MNKFSKYFAAFASLAVLASCSNDEPGNGGGEPVIDGDAAYINVTLQDSYDLSRAGEEADPDPDQTLPADDDKNFEYETGDPGKVKNAKFFFFDETGRYYGQANVWNGGKPETKPEGTSIEFKGETVVILKNQKTNTTPKYMVTLLNFGNEYDDPALDGVSLDEFGKMITKTDDTNKGWGNNSTGGFRMTTSSYFKGNGEDIYHDDKYYFATVLQSNNFQKTPELAKTTNPVPVYVERLAARVRLAIPNTEYIPVEVTVFGEPNTDTGTTDKPTGEAATKLFVKLEGWGLYNDQNESYLSKQITSDTYKWDATYNFSKDTEKYTTAGVTMSNWTAWNHANFHRSYWAQSVNYANIPEADGKTLNGEGNNGYSNAITTKDNVSVPLYCSELTSTVTDLNNNNNGVPNQRKLTNVMIKARIYQQKDGAYSSISLIEHNGLYFTDNRFIAYALDVVKTNGGLNIYVENGTDDKTSEKLYKQVGVEYFTVEGTSSNNEKVVVEAKETLKGLKLYYKGSNSEGVTTYTEYTNVASTVETLNENLAKVSTNITRRATDGYMVYAVPIAHLRAKKYDTEVDDKSLSSLTGWGEGSFGVVRNHTYEVNVNSVKRLGQFVFDPDKGGVKPDTELKPEWYMGATINILSWRIVTNNVDL